MLSKKPSSLNAVARHGAGTRRYPDRIAILAVMILTALAMPVASAGAAADRSTSPVRTFSGGSPVGSSTLVRTDNGISATVETTELAPDDVLTLWWVVFNNPAACEHPIPGSVCGPGDAHNSAPDGPQPSLLHAAGRIVSEEGTAEYGAHLRVGDTSRALFGPGLVDARAAHVVLVLKTHGPRIPDLVSEQRSTLAGGCNNQDDVPPGAPQELVGTPGPNDCTEIQFTVHSSQ